jgi:hypothetical protein
MIDSLLLISKNDIPFPQAAITLHQPTLKEIAYIGEKTFFSGIQFLNFGKDDLRPDEKKRLSDLGDFDIVMKIANAKDVAAQQSANQAKMLLALVFPEYQVSLTQKGIILIKDEESRIIDKKNFSAFLSVLNEMFASKFLSVGKQNEEYNPDGKLAEQIAKKFKDYHQKLAKQKGQQQSGQKIAILSRYISILSVGQKRDINSYLSYTVYQLLDEFQRYTLKQQSDMYIQAKMAGAQNLEEVDSWMKDIYESSI